MESRGSIPITVVIATLDEAPGIGPTIEELGRIVEDPHFLVVDGNSRDRTAEIAKDMGASVIFQEGAGKGRAIAQAMRQVDSGTRYVVFIDADFTYPAEYIPRMVRVLEESPDVGMVIGNRFNHRLTLSSMKSLHFIGNRFLAATQRFLNGVKLRDPLTGLRVVRWQLLKNWMPKSRGFDVEAELNHWIERKGYKIVEVPIFYRERLGEKKLKLWHGFKILRRILLESMTS